VREVVVKLQKFDENDERLVAFLYVLDEFNMSEKEIVDTLALTLPQYMVPKLFQRSNGFPRLPNGKINKKALFFETCIPDQKEKEKASILSPTEELIYNIWSEALKIRNISIRDNFFDIGGNSLMAITVFSKIELKFNVEMDLRIFFDAPRIKDLAKVINTLKHKLNEPIITNYNVPQI
jgi:acyl carrier protein